MVNQSWPESVKVDWSKQEAEQVGKNHLESAEVVQIQLKSARVFAWQSYVWGDFKVWQNLYEFIFLQKSVRSFLSLSG